MTAKGFSVDAVLFEADIGGQGRPRKIRHEFIFAGEKRKGRDGDTGVTVSPTPRLHDFGAQARAVTPAWRDICAGQITSL